MGTITNKIENFKMNINESFVQKAKVLEPELHYRTVFPKEMISIARNREDWYVTGRESAETVKETVLAKGYAVCLDFRDHCVGYVTFALRPVGSPPDAPAHIRIKLGETLCEIGEESAEYHGSISSSWIQEEYLHIDVLPARITLPRRYAFRYAELRVLDTSPKYQIVIEEMECRTVTSADRSAVLPLPENMPEELKKMDAVALKTMEDCMQKVFEDGPKRDRRLWIGDLRLQALTNYETYRNYDMVKRCLYLFAGLTQNEGHVGACLFIEPEMQVDDTALYDYGLFFISCLFDYYNAAGDRETLEELWETAYRQAVIAMQRVGEDGVVKDSDDWWCFLDWNDDLNKQGGAQGVLIYTLKQAVQLAEVLGKTEQRQELEQAIEKAEYGAKEVLWDEKTGFFTSGSERQISWATQVWMVLAEVFPQNKNREILRRLLEVRPAVRMVTPYMYHHLVDALIRNGMKQEALTCMEAYWGQMVKDGADCFYELYDPEDKYASPYGSRIINSYCHAWSCTPSYLIRKYFAEEYKND